MDINTIIGTAATVASVSSFTPQAWKIIKARDTRGVSKKMYALTVAGFTLWFIYGWRTYTWPLIITNGICLVLSSFILAVTLWRNGKRADVDHLDSAPAN